MRSTDNFGSRSINNEGIKRGYCTISVVLDDRGLERVPIGIAVWDQERKWFSLRRLKHSESVERVTARDRFLMEVALDHVTEWAADGSVPGSDKITPPYSSEFWHAAASRLTTAIRIERPLALELPQDADDYVVSLFDAIVGPRAKPAETRRRIDTEVKKALGESLSGRLRRRLSVRAFGDAVETASWGVETDAGVLVIDGVNLANRHGARGDADALVSRLRRIRAGNADKDVVRLIVCYVSSPNGLNGEAHMREWIRQEATERIFDCNQDRDAIRKEVAQSQHDIQDRFAFTT